MKNKNSLLLLELMLNILIFALCAAVCLSLLFCARAAMDESRELSRAVYVAQTVAETYEGQDELVIDDYTAKCRQSGDKLTIQVFSPAGKKIYTLVAHGGVGA